MKEALFREADENGNGSLSDDEIDIFCQKLVHHFPRFKVSEKGTQSTIFDSIFIGFDLKSYDFCLVFYSVLNSEGYKEEYNNQLSPAIKIPGRIIKKLFMSFGDWLID